MTPTHAQLAERCAEVLALSDKATPGPWDTDAVFGERHWDVVLNYPTPIEGSPVVVASTYGEDGRMTSEEGASYNARFIAAAPRMAQCIRELLDALREAERDARRYQWLRREAGSMHGPEVYVGDTYHLGSEMDAAIDAALNPEAKT